MLGGIPTPLHNPNGVIWGDECYETCRTIFLSPQLVTYSLKEWLIMGPWEGVHRREFRASSKKDLLPTKGSVSIIKKV